MQNRILEKHRSSDENVPCGINRKGFKAAGPAGVGDGITELQALPRLPCLSLFPSFVPSSFHFSQVPKRRGRLDTEPQPDIFFPPCSTGFSQPGSRDHLEG